MALDSRIKNAKTLAKEAFGELKEIQTGKKPIIKTGQDFIDCHIGGLLPSDVIVLAAGSGVGKTKLLYDTLDLMLDTEVNTNADDIVSLEFSLEMKFLNRIIRDVHKKTGKKKSLILKDEFSEEEKEIVRRYYESLQDDRRFVCEDTITDKEFYEMTREFCKQNEEKHAVIISLDHLLLVLPDNKSLDRFETIANYVNQLRKEFKNVYFILLSQFNRLSFQNVADRSNDMVPKASMIYGSSHFEFLSSYIIGIMDPFKMGVTEFMKVNRERYEWLEDFMVDEDKKGKVAFDTVGNLFYFCLKARESDNPFKNLFIREMDLNADQKDIMNKEFKTPEMSLPKTPVFGDEQNPYKNVKPNFNTNDAFGIVEENSDDVPF